MTNKFIYKIFFFIIFIILISQKITNSVENRIIYKIDNEIITSLEIEDEIIYLQALNPNLKNLSKKEILEISKKSLVKEKIKKIAISKNFENAKIPIDFLEKLLRNVYSKIGINNLIDFKNYLKINNIEYKKVLKKIEIEALWNELIVVKFSAKIKINEDNLKKNIIKNSNNTSKSYLMSEIFFEIEKTSDLENKYQKIKKTIEEKGFDNAALIFSISQTSNFGGKLDWINEKSLNQKIKKEIDKININEFSKPISVPGGFLILQINDIKIEKLKTDLNEELKNAVRVLKNNQFNQYSKIYFNKIKKDIQIDEI